MKKILTILLFIALPAVSVFAQNDDPGQEGKIPERMRTYIQNRLGLNKSEAERFSPVFFRYFREFAQTHREFKDDRLIMQQKIIDLRLRYRNEFRQIMDDSKANRVYYYEDEFRKKAIDIIRENKRDRVPPRRNQIIKQ